MAAASALLAVGLAGPPLYVSSATSKALQTSLAATCPSDAGVLLDVPATAVAGLDERAATIEHVESPVHTEIAGIRVRGTDSSSPAQLVWRDGLTSIAAGSIAEPADGEVAVPGSYAAGTSLRAGDRITATAAGGTAPVSFDVAGIYPDIPVQPEPAYWCGLRDLLRPDGTGDAPAPMLLAEQATVRDSTSGTPTTLWELHPDPDHLTRSAALDLLDDLHAVVAVAGESTTSNAATVAPVAAQTDPALGRLIDRADDVGDTVARGLIGLRLAALAIAVGLLAAAAFRIVHARRPELRLRITRGERPVGIALRLAEGLALPALAGTILGAAGAYAGVRALGPAPDIDASAVQRAMLLAVIGLIGAIVVAAATGAARANELVDRPPRTKRRVTPPWELVPIVLAVIAFARLDRASGVRIVGTDVAPGDGLGDAFPVLALVAAGAVLVRPLRWLFGRARHGGSRFGPSLLLGWRRLGADPGRHAFLAGAVAAGVGAAIVASSLGQTTDRLVDDKATTFLGADVRVVTAGEPVIPDDWRATPISRLAARAGRNEVQVVGIDPDTFAAAVHWRDDAAAYPMAELLRVLGADDMKGAPLPAVVVGGPVPSTSLVGDDGVEIDITPVATAAFFPGKTSAPMVVVNRNALAADEVPTAAEIWLRDPSPDATRELAAAGNLVRGSQGEADVFETASVQAVRWSDQALWAFAAFVAVATLIGALLVVGSRRDERRAGRALTRLMGEPVHQELLAAVVACGVPVVLGAAGGLAAGALTVRLLADHIDTVSNLPPPADIVYDLMPAVAGGLIAALVVVTAAVAARALVGRRAVGEVMSHVRRI